MKDSEFTDSFVFCPKESREKSGIKLGEKIMQKKYIGMLFALGIMGILLPFAQVIAITPIAATVDPSNYTDITVDGVIGDSEWMGDNVSIHEDPDTVWGGAGVDSLYVAINETGIFFGLKSHIYGGGNPRMIFIDMNSSTGITDQSASVDVPFLDRDIVFTGMKPDFVIYGNDTLFQLYKYDGSGSETQITTGVESAVQTFDALNPIGTAYEMYVPFDALYTTLPANAMLKLAAAHFGGTAGADKWADIMPNDGNPSTQTQEYAGHMDVQISNDAAEPEIIANPAIVWSGNGELTNDLNGMVIRGEMADFYYENYYGMHDPVSTLNYPILHYRLYESGVASAWTDIKMEYTFGDHSGDNDVYRYSLDTTSFAEDVIMEWFINTTFDEGTKVNITIGPMPPIDIGFVGSVFPNGGFQYPDQSFDITVDIEQIWNGTDDTVQKDVGTVVTLNYTTDPSSSWNLLNMTFLDKAGTRNVRYNGTIGPFSDGDTLLFNIIVTNNNTVSTGNFSILIMVPPPEQQIYYQDDPTGDEYGTYPGSDAFKDENGNVVDGLFDILAMNVSSSAYTTSFHFLMRNITDPGWGAAYWSHLLFAIMINDGSETGSHEGIGKSYVTTEGVWQYGIQVDGWVSKYFTPDTLNDPLTQTGITRDFVNDSSDYWFTFTVPETLFSATANENWTYYAMVGSGDMNEFRDHKAAAEDWKFGGGDDGDSDPNFCDILVPTSGNMTTDAESQDFIAHSYDVATSTRAVLFPVGPGIAFVADTVAPTVEITAPADGDVIDVNATTASVTISWTVVESTTGTFHGLDYVELYVDGVLVPDVTDTTTVDLANGTHTIRVNAFDKTGNFGFVEITITVNASESTGTTSEKTGIPGYGLGFMVIAFLGAALVLLKKYRK